MAKPRALVLVGEGINCDLETAEALEEAMKEAGGHARRIYLGDITTLREYQILAIPGGFAYGDDIAAGKVYALRMKEKLRNQIREFVEKDGLILRICNGAQIGIKMPLPGFDADGKQAATFT